MGLFHFTSASARAITSDLASFMDFKPLFLKTFVVIPQRSRPYQTNLATTAFHPESISDFTPPMPPFSPSCIPHCTEPSRNQNTVSENCPRVFKSLAISFCSFLPNLTSTPSRLSPFLSRFQACYSFLDQNFNFCPPTGTSKFNPGNQTALLLFLCTHSVLL